MNEVDRGLLGGFTFVVLFLALCALLAGCGPTYDHGWTVEGDASESFTREVTVTAEVIRSQESVLHREWGGTVTVYAAPFPCPDGGGLCAGYDDGDHHILVAYAPTLGLGPAVGTTALAHEFCHAARYLRGIDGSDETAANACAANAMPEIERRMIQ